MADAVVARYIEVGLLDDAALAMSIARARHVERGLTPRAIAIELRRKGFSADDIGAALAPMTPEILDARAHEIAERRWNQLVGVAEPARSRRVAAMLSRKGYSPSLAFSVVKELARADNAGD